MTQDTDSTPYALVVDDNGLILVDACQILEDAGYRTLEAITGDAAMVVLQANHARVRLLFTDVQMPGSLDGFALAREVARCWPHISIVVASGQARPQTDDLPAGAAFIDKPFSADIVHQRLRSTFPDAQLPDRLTRQAG